MREKGNGFLALWLRPAEAAPGAPALWLGVAGLGLLTVTACRATVAGDPDRPIKIEAHITLDIRQVKETATSIEEIVSGQAPMPQQKPRSQVTDGFNSVAWAETPQLKYTTPEVQSALDSRRDRFSRLKEFKGKGLVGEDKEGHVKAFSDDSDLKALVDGENRDRETIYKTIVEQNGLAPEAINTIRATFAEVQREKAESGEKIQLPSGEWSTK